MSGEFERGFRVMELLLPSGEESFTGLSQKPALRCERKSAVYCGRCRHLSEGVGSLVARDVAVGGAPCGEGLPA